MKLLPILLLLPFLSACSTFDQRWKNETIPSIPNTLAGKWTGEWASYAGHRGELKAIIVPILLRPPITAEAAASQPAPTYHAFFKATYGVIFTAEYHVDFTATPTPDGESFSGDKDLGYFAGGLYHYQGTLRHDDLQTNYQSPLDHGTFTLHRAP